MTEKSQSAAGEGARTATETVARGQEELLALSQAQLEAAARTGTAVLQGSSEVTQLWLGFWNEQLALTLDRLRALGACGSAREMLELQNDYARTSLERFCTTSAEATQLSGRALAASLEPTARTAAGKARAA